MVVSRRERLIVEVAAAIVGLLAADRVVLSPLLAARQEMAMRTSRLEAELSRARKSLQRARSESARWDAIRATIPPDPEQAESRLLHALRSWAEESRMALSMVKPQQVRAKSRLPQMGLRASGSGSMESIVAFLWRLETAKLPIRITDLHLSARSEAADLLDIELGITTIYLPAGPQTAEASK